MSRGTPKLSSIQFKPNRLSLCSPRLLSSLPSSPLLPPASRLALSPLRLIPLYRHRAVQLLTPVQLSTPLTLDANRRWLHTTSGYTDCYTGNAWNTTLCPDGETCAANCALDSADYTGAYGVTASGNTLTLKFVTQDSYSKNIGSRLYLMASDSKYQMFKLLNQKFSFDVDVSNLPCGLNGALYLVEMDEDGGMAKYSTNKAGAKYGTGYCDTQCPHDIKFINGEANVVN